MLFLFTASLEAVSYRVGSYTYQTPGNVVTQDSTYTKLFDGKKDSGNQTILAVDFWGKAEDQKYLDIIWDFTVPVLIQYGNIFGKNHSSVYSCKKVEFFIADENGNRTLASERPGSDNLLWNAKSDLIGLYGRYLIFRVWGGTRVNIEEIEADFIVFPNPPQDLKAKRLSLSKVEFEWKSSPPAADGKGASFYRIYNTLTPDFVPTLPPILETQNTRCTIELDSSAAFIAVYAVDFEGNESLIAARETLPAVGGIRGNVIWEGGPISGVHIESQGKITKTDENGFFILEPISVGICTIHAYLRGYISQSVQVDVAEGKIATTLIQMEKSDLYTSSPTNPEAKRQGINNVQLTWTPPSEGNAIAYRIFKGTEPSYSKAILLARTIDTSWMDQRLDSGNYYYFITSISATEHESAPTIALSVEIPELKSPLLLSPKDGHVISSNPQSSGFADELNWQGTQESIGFKVLIDGPGGPWIHDVITSNLSIPQEVLTQNNTWFTWRVGAIYDHELEPVFSKPQRFMVSNFPYESPFTISEVGISSNPYKQKDGPAVFSFSLSEEAHVTWELYNLSGWLIDIKKFEGNQGVNLFEWDGTDRYGGIVRPGFYYFLIKAARNGKTIISQGSIMVRR